MDKTAATIETYDLCADAFAEKFMGLELYGDSLEAFAGLLSPGSRVLDLGCGPGNVSRFLAERVAKIEITGIDLSGEMVKLARKNLPEARFMVEDIRKFDLPEGSMDAVVAPFCIPFLYDGEVLELIPRICRVLTPGGHLYISCMEGSGSGFETASFSAGKRLFFNYFSESFLTGAFEDHELTVLEQIRQDYPEEDGSITTDMIFILRNDGPVRTDMGR